MTVPHSALFALMVWCVLLVPLAAQAESDCQTVAKQSVAVQGVRHEQAQANLDRMMSGITDTLFDVDCLVSRQIMNDVGDMPGWGGHGIGGDALAHIGNSHYGSIGETVRQSIPMERK